MFTQMLKADLEAASATSVLTAHTEVSYLSTALSLVNEGLGVTICQPYAKPLVSLYGLTSQVINKPVISRRFYVFSQKGRAIAPATQAFREFLKAFVAQNL
jgi:DNA-binding transcriptional LysR family regulator